MNSWVTAAGFTCPPRAEEEARPNAEEAQQKSDCRLVILPIDNLLILSPLRSTANDHPARRLLAMREASEVDDDVFVISANDTVFDFDVVVKEAAEILSVFATTAKALTAAIFFRFTF